MGFPWVPMMCKSIIYITYMYIYIYIHTYIYIYIHIIIYIYTYIQKSIQWNLPVSFVFTFLASRQVQSGRRSENSGHGRPQTGRGCVKFHLIPYTPSQYDLHGTLWLCQNSYWKWPFRVTFPLKLVIFHSYVKITRGYPHISRKMSSPSPFWTPLHLPMVQKKKGPPGSHAMDRVARVVQWRSPANPAGCIGTCHILETMAKQLDAAYCDEALRVAEKV